MGARLAKPARSAVRRKGDVAADEAVYGAIRRAMHMGRLAPGTKLQEPALARVLEGEPRARAQGAAPAGPRGLAAGGAQSRHLRAGADGRGDAARSTTCARCWRPPSCGASAPSTARRRRSGSRRTSTRRRQAVRTDDRGRLFGLSGEFHVLLAELCGNDELTQLAARPADPLDDALFAVGARALPQLRRAARSRRHRRRRSWRATARRRPS